MKAIIKRELSNYFSSPIGYVVLVIFYLFSGLFFNSYNLVAQNTSMSSLFSSIVNLLGFLVPVLTMRLMSEEKKQRTDQLLLTSPVSLPGLVLGKLLSCYIVYVLMLSLIHISHPPGCSGSAPGPCRWVRCGRWRQGYG